MKTAIYLLTTLLILVEFTSAQTGEDRDKFKQLKDEFATPNEYRTASGAPGHAYYQQQADYVIDVKLDDEHQIIRGSEEITFHNNSPDVLTYIWVQLDQNVRAHDSESRLISTDKIGKKERFDDLEKFLSEFDGGFKIESVKDLSGKDIPHYINKTMMRVDLRQPLRPKEKISFRVKWWYHINDRMKIGGRSGFEFFEEDGNYLYTIAQFYPRMAVYNDVEGWQNKQFLGRGEFTLAFGNYQVSITVPSDHIVAATGELQNSGEVLSAEQQKRLSAARNEYAQPVLIATPDEALQNEKSRSDKLRTWKFKAQNVRDFAFASSRKFIWDAMATEIGGKTIMAMSFYPREGNPLWGKYATKVVSHTIKTYSKYTVNYSYPVAQAIHSKSIGMEYPMICFNGGRPEKDGTYSKETKYGMISVIIHEVGHNFFPMIINSDERQWTWMDEGLNTFVEQLTEQEWEMNYPSRRGLPISVVEYMKGDKSRISPIMTNSESIYQFGNNAYAKTAAALNILRETVMGRELFDYSFKTYCQRWAYKSPTPEDFFRTLEDASAVDLDWFWRGWFYTTDHVDLAIEDVQWYVIDNRMPDYGSEEEGVSEDRQYIGRMRNRDSETYLLRDSSLKDFYNEAPSKWRREIEDDDFKTYISGLTDDEKKLLESKKQFYLVHLKKIGGLVMPVILEFEFYDGSKEVRRIPAEIWKPAEERIAKAFYFDREVKAINLDPFMETADVDVSNNSWTVHGNPAKFQLYKTASSREKREENPMQRKKRIDSGRGGNNGEHLQQEIGD